MKIKKIVALISVASVMATSFTAISVPTVSAETVNTATKYSEDFDGHSSDVNYQPTLQELKAYGWYMADNDKLYDNVAAVAPYSTYNYKIAKIATKDGKCLQVVSAGEKHSGNDANVPNFGYGKTFPGIEAGEAATGSWEIYFDFRPVLISNKTQFSFTLNTGDNSASGTTARHNIISGYGQRFYLGYRDYNQLLDNSISQGEIKASEIGGDTWYRVKTILNCDAGYYSVELYNRSTGKLVARRSPISFDANETIGFLKFSALGYAQGSWVFVDNISIEQITENALIYEDGFEYGTATVATATMSLGGTSEDVNGTSYFEGQHTPWRALGTSGKDYGLDSDTVLEGKVLRLGDNSGTPETEASGLVYMPVYDKLLADAAAQGKRGKIKVSFKIKPDNIGASGFQLNAVPDYNKSSIAVFELADNSGTPAIVTNTGNVNLDASKWYDAEVLIDVVNNNATTLLKNHATSTKVAKFTSDIASLTEVKGLVFNAVGGTTVHMDDVKIEYSKEDPTEDPDPDPVVTNPDENTDERYFESFETFVDDENLLDNLMKNGWYLAGDMRLDTDKSNYPEDLVKVVDYKGRKCLKIKATKRADTAEDIGIGRKFPGQGEDINSTSGIWEINFKFYAGEQFLFSTNTLDGSAANAKGATHSILAAYSNTIYMGYRDYYTLFKNKVTQGTLSKTGGFDDWYDAKVILNCDNRYYSVELYKDGKLVARRSPISFNGNETVGYLKLSALGVGKDNVVYVDDVSIKPASKETLIYADGFEYGSSALTSETMSLGGEEEDKKGKSFFEGFTPWRALEASGKDYGLENDTVLGSKVLRLGDNSATAGTIEKTGLVYMIYYENLVTTATQKKRGKLGISFKIKPSAIGASGFQINAAPDFNADLVKVFEIKDNSGTPVIEITDTESVNLNASKWYDTELVLDVINNRVTTTVKDHATLDEVAKFTSDIASLTAVRGLVFNAVGGTTVLMDDVKLEYDDAGASIDFNNMTDPMQIVDVKFDGKSVSTISDIANGATVNVKIACSNKTNVALNGLLSVSYYEENKLLATSSMKPNIKVGEEGIKSFNLTVPTGINMNKVDKISVSLWKGFNNATPYCDTVDFVKASETAPTLIESNTVKPKITYSYKDSRLNISGKAGADSKYLTVQILNGVSDTFIACDGLENADNKVLYRAQAPIKDGKYSLNIRYDAGIAKGEYPVAIYIDGVKQDIDKVSLVPYSAFETAYDNVNGALGNFATFKTVLNNNLSELNFDSKLVGDTPLGDEIQPYYDYLVANGPLDKDKETENTERFNSYVAATCLNAKKVDNIADFTDYLLFKDNNVKEYCNEFLTTDTKGKYFTGLVSAKGITDPDKLEKSFKEALILTATRYGNGYGELKKVLSSFGAELGITTTVSDAACIALMGQIYNSVAEFKDAYANAAKPKEPSSSAGGGTSIATIKTPTNPTSEAIVNVPIKKTFNDIDNYEWAMTEILALANKNIISGVDENRFEPERSITREEFAKIIVSALGASDYSYSKNVFSDASDGDWFVKYINIAAELGIVNGTGVGVFGTGNYITRQDMAVMIYNALKYRNVNVQTGDFKFDDDGQIADYAKNAVAVLHEMGAINGVTETTFEPKGIATRAQAAKIVYRVLNELQD